MNDYGAKYISEYLLKQNNSLISLNLSWNKIGDIGVKHISNALNLNINLKN